jgi:hypothetical protein
MGLTDRLNRLDAVVLPRLGRGARRIGQVRKRSLVLPAIALVALGAVGVSLLTERSPAPISQPSIRVGVFDGESIPGYFATSRNELAQLLISMPDRPVYALASFTGYLRPTEVAAVVTAAGGATTFSASARVPLLHRQTELVRLAADRVPADLVAAMTVVADRKDQEAADAVNQARTSTGPAADQAASDAAVDTAEAQAYRAACACVYALVVRATPAGLTRLANLDQVRGVDPAPELADLTGAVFVAPLPEQGDVVRPPDDDLMPGSTTGPTATATATAVGVTTRGERLVSTG